MQIIFDPSKNPHSSPQCPPKLFKILQRLCNVLAMDLKYFSCTALLSFLSDSSNNSFIMVLSLSTMTELENLTTLSKSLIGLSQELEAFALAKNISGKNLINILICISQKMLSNGTSTGCDHKAQPFPLGCVVATCNLISGSYLQPGPTTRAVAARLRCVFYNDSCA